MAQDWQPVTGAHALRDFVGGKTFSWQEGEGSSWGEYRDDGTGTVHAWGAKIDRTWEVKGDDQICFHGKPDSQCYTLEQSTADPSLYRVTNVETGQRAEVRITDSNGVYTPIDEASRDANSSGPAQASAAEMAAKLANPSTPVGLLTSNLDLTFYGGELPDASKQVSFAYSFQPQLPFPLSNGKSFFFRPFFQSS